MSNTNENTTNNINAEIATDQAREHGIEQDADVLYQKLGEQWYAFTLVNNEVFMAQVSDQQIQSIQEQNREKNRDKNKEKPRMPSAFENDATSEISNEINGARPLHEAA